MRGVLGRTEMDGGAQLLFALLTSCLEGEGKTEVDMPSVLTNRVLISYSYDVNSLLICSYHVNSLLLAYL